VVRALSLAPLLVLLACAVQYSRTLAPVRSAMVDGGDAVEVLDEQFPDSSGNDRLLYLLEKGNLLRLAGRYDEAIRFLLEADRLSDLQRGTEVGQEAAALLTSDLAREFRGADYEKVLINYCLAACYASLGNMEDALVECRRVGEKLQVFNDEYVQDNRYRDDAFVRYFMGILFEADGDYDDALVAYRNALRVYEEDYSGLYGLEPPARLLSDLLRVSSHPGFENLHADFASRWPDLSWESGEGCGEVVVIIEEGLIPPRYERSVQGYSEDRVFRLAVPGISEVGRPRSSVRLASGGRQEAGFLAEDISAIAARNLEDSAGRDLARAIARAAAKAAAAGLAEGIVENLTDEEDGFWSDATGLAVSIFGAATEHADLRAWLTLPARISVARMYLLPGDSEVSVLVGGRTVLTRTLHVREGEIEILFASVPGWK